MLHLCVRCVWFSQNLIFHAHHHHQYSTVSGAHVVLIYACAIWARSSFIDHVSLCTPSTIYTPAFRTCYAIADASIKAAAPNLISIHIVARPDALNIKMSHNCKNYKITYYYYYYCTKKSLR